MPLETESIERPSLFEMVFGKNGYCCDYSGRVRSVRMKLQGDGNVMFKYRGEWRYGFAGGEVLHDSTMVWWFK